MRLVKRRRFSRMAGRQPMEALEGRLLMAANMIVLGGFDNTNYLEVQIANNGSPTSADCTDFGYDDTINTALNAENTPFNAMTHSFAIINQPTDGSSTVLNLTGPVAMTGDTTDFTLGAQPSNTAVSASTGVPQTNDEVAAFQVTFQPKTAGLHTATLTFTTDDPSNPNFTIQISGAGAAFTALPSGTEYYTVQSGSGTLASSGATLAMDYTGYTTDGLIFDTSLQSGRTALSFTLGQGQVIAGWDLGLLGIQEGESRVLLIPSDQAYPDATSDNGEPAGELVFTTTANSVTGAIGADFLPNLYHDILQRTADIAGLNYWNEKIYETGMTAATVVSSFINSTEYQQNRITALYDTVLERAPDAGGLSYWEGYLTSGNTVEQMEAQFYGSPEFAAQHGDTTAGTLTGLYQVLLQRQPDTAGLTYWENQVAAGQSVSQVAYSIIRAPEGLSASVENIYVLYLHRTADSVGLSYWTGKLAGTGQSETDVIAGIMSAPEYYTA